MAASHRDCDNPIMFFSVNNVIILVGLCHIRLKKSTLARNNEVQLKPCEKQQRPPMKNPHTSTAVESQVVCICIQFREATHEPPRLQSLQHCDGVRGGGSTTIVN